MSEKKIKLCIVITGLGVGGAEHALLRVLSHFDYTRFDITLLVLRGEDILTEQFKTLPIKVISLGLAPGKFPFRQIKQIQETIRAEAPDILQGWMYHGNLAASFVSSRLTPPVPVCWSVRDTPDAGHNHSLFTKIVIKISNYYAFKVERIFNVSAYSADYCSRRLGWPRDRTEVLPNGIDSTRFVQDFAMRQVQRKRWQVPNDAMLIGMVARWDKVKNHRLFLESAALFRKKYPDAYFVMAGKDIDADNLTLTQWIDQLGLQDHVKLLGSYERIEHFYPALDVLSLTSKSEGFPNVLAESMSCTVPVVTTDVGDARDIVGVNTGKVKGIGGLVVPAAPKAFVEAWTALMNDVLRFRMGAAGRERIKNVYALDTVVNRLQQSYVSIVEEHRHLK